MKTKVLKKLRSQACRKYRLDFKQDFDNPRLVHYHIMQCVNDQKNIVASSLFLDEAIEILKETRRKDILTNTDILRFKKIMRRMKRGR